MSGIELKNCGKTALRRIILYVKPNNAADYGPVRILRAVALLSEWNNMA